MSKEAVPIPILADECLLPNGARVVIAPRDGWIPKPKQPQVSDAAWWSATLGTAFMLGIMVCLLVMAVVFRVGGARLVLRGAEVVPTTPAATEQLQRDMLEAATAAGDVREGPGGSGEAVAP